MIFDRMRLGMWALALALVFVVLSTFVPRVTLLTILNGVFLGIVAATLIVYSPLIWLTFRKVGFDRVSQLSLGVGLLFLSIASQRLYWIIWHIYGTPPSWQSNPVLAAIAFVSIIGGALFVTAPGFPPANSPEPIVLGGSNRKLLLILGGLGGVVTFIVSVTTGAIN